MWKLLVSFGDLKKEEQFINNQQKKTLFLNNKCGPFYLFKKTSTLLNKTFIELSEREQDNNYDGITTLLEKNIPFSKMKKTYYQFDTDEMDDQNITQDERMQLAYYRLNLNKYRVALYGFYMVLIFFMGMNGYANTGIRANRIAFLIVVIGMLLTVSYFVITKKSRKIIKKYTTLMSDFDDEIRTRFIVQIDQVDEKDIQSLMDNFGYLGIWNFRFLKNGKAYFYLMSKSNEELLKETLVQALGEEHSISVTPPTLMFPIGYI